MTEMAFTAKEAALFRLATDPAATDGERSAASRALGALLRKRGAWVEDTVTIPQPEPTPQPAQPQATPHPKAQAAAKPNAAVPPTWVTVLGPVGLVIVGIAGVAALLQGGGPHATGASDAAPPAAQAPAPRTASPVVDVSIDHHCPVITPRGTVTGPTTRDGSYLVTTPDDHVYQCEPRFAQPYVYLGTVATATKTQCTFQVTTVAPTVMPTFPRWVPAGTTTQPMSNGQWATMTPDHQQWICNQTP